MDCFSNHPDTIKLYMTLEEDDKETGIIEPSKTPEIKSIGGRIQLRQFTQEDAREIFELIDRNRDHLSQFGDDTAQKYPTYESVLESIVNPKKPKRLRFAIRTRGTGEFLGSINLTPDEDNPERGEVGYYMGSQHQGKGFATEAVNMLCGFAFEEKGYRELYAKVHSDNKASQKVLIKTGFIQTGTKDGDLIFLR